MLWAHGLVLLLGAALASGACGDDASSKKGQGDQGGAGGDAAAGEPAAGGSAVVGGGTTGEGGTAPSGIAGNADAGQTGEGGAGGAAAAGITLDQFCELQVRAREWLRECRPFFGDASGWWGAQNIDQFCSSGREAIEAGRLIYDPVQAAACAELSVGGCEDIEAFAFGVGQPQSGFLQSSVCEGVVTGTVALGDACHANSQLYASECVEGFCSSDACPGTCTAYSEVNDSCDGSSSACDPATAYCDAEQCQPLSGVGEPCDGLLPCAPGLTCWTGIDSSACVMPVAAGQPCEAATDLCVAGAICRQGECATQVPLGQPCNSATQCPADAYCSETCQQAVPLNGDCSGGQQCVAGTTCVADACRLYGQAGEDCPCETGLWCDAANDCQPPGGVDEACDPRYLGTCELPLFCDPTSSQCVAPAAENDPCNFATPLDSCQAGLYCSCSSGCGVPYQATASCQPRLADDADCSRSEQCLSGTCTNLKCATPPLCK
jgi:hypothetical protein